MTQLLNPPQEDLTDLTNELQSLDLLLKSYDQKEQQQLNEKEAEETLQELENL